MRQFAFLARGVILTYLCVYQSYATCTDGLDDSAEGIYGQAINLSCTASNSSPCSSIHWQNRTSRRFLDTAETDRLSINMQGRTSVLQISRLTLDDVGNYTCWCYLKNGRSDSPVCSVALTTICQAKLVVNSETIFHNSTSRTHYVNVAEGTRIRIKCPEGRRPESDCPDVIKRESGECTYSFVVVQRHDSCHIECRLGSKPEDSCSIHLTLRVTILETPTQPLTTSTVASTISSQSFAKIATVSTQTSVKQSIFTAIPNDRFPVMLLVGISIAIFVGILFMICFFLYFSRSKSTSRPKKTQTPVNKSSDTNIPIGPTYATVNKSSPGGTKDDDDSERGIPCADDAYAEVDSSGKGESSTQQVNAVKAETTITKDYYSVVNTSNAKLEPMDSGNKSDSALYTEVNKGDNQVEKKQGTSSPESSDCNPNVPDVQSYEVLEQPESSEYDDVGVVSTSPALYAVVDKEI